MKQGNALGNKSTRDRGFVLVALTASSQRTQALAASPSDSRIRRTLIDGAGYHCSHSIAISGDVWPDELRLSDIEARFVCRACGKRGADVRPFCSATRGAAGLIRTGDPSDA